MEIIVTREFLRTNRETVVFVFGDNQERSGRGGAARLRNEENTYGFITKISPSRASEAHYTPENYGEIFWEELDRLIDTIEANPDKFFMISKIGSSLANKYNIFEQIIEPNLYLLNEYPNVIFLWDR
jgi:hypothetical protein